MKPTRLIPVLMFTLLCSLMLSGATPSHAQATPQAMPTLRDIRDQTGGFAQTRDSRSLNVSLVTIETDGSTAVTEFGASDTFTIALSSQPAAPIKLRHHRFPYDIIVLPIEVIFTPENWNVPQTLTVYAVHDYNAESETTPPINYYRYSAESWNNGVYDYSYTISLGFPIYTHHTAMPIPTGPLVVTTTADSVSAEIPGSLRQMVNIASSRPGADIITFQSGLSGTIYAGG